MERDLGPFCLIISDQTRILVPITWTFGCDFISDNYSIMFGKLKKKAKGLASLLDKEKRKKELREKKS